jgi:hypothetical protein
MALFQLFASPRLVAKPVFCVTLLFAVMPLSSIGQAMTLDPVPSGVKDQVIHQSAVGLWALTYDATKPGVNCGIKYVSNKSNGTTLTFKGPTPALASGSIIFAGPDIPGNTLPTQTRVDMLFEGEAPANVRAIHAPRAGNIGYVLVPTADIKASIDPIRDVEKNIGLKLNDT